MRFFLAAALAMLFASVPAHARWRTASSAHFVVYSEQTPEQLKRYAETLERYDATLRLLSGAPNRRSGPASRVTVFLVSDLVQLRRVFGDRTSSVAGFYIPRAEKPVAFAPVADGGSGPLASTVLSSQTVLLHEYAHHFMYLNVGGNYPSWYREGFAEFVAASTFGSDGSVTIGGAANHRAYGLAGGAVTIADVVLRDQPAKAVDQDEFYARSWQLLHYLTFSTDRKGQLDAYLRAVTGGTPRAQAATAAFGDLAKLEREARSYMSRRAIPGLKLALTLIPIPAVTVRELNDAEDAAVPVRITSWRGVDPAQADALLPRARALGARYPNDPMAQNAVAEAEIDAGNFAEAIAAADRVLAAAPNDADAMIFRGQALMGQAIADKSSDPAAWKEVRRWYIAASRIDRDDPAPLLYFYRSFAAAGEPVSGNAALALTEAARLAPQDIAIQMMLARQMMAKGDVAGSKRQLALIGNAAHGRSAGRFGSVWTALDAQDSAAALRAFDDAVKPPAAAKE